MHRHLIFVAFAGLAWRRYKAAREFSHLPLGTIETPGTCSSRRSHGSIRPGKRHHGFFGGSRTNA
jgi:hypothetical protein